MVQQWWGLNSFKALHMFDRRDTGYVGTYFLFANVVYSLVCNGACGYA